MKPNLVQSGQSVQLSHQTEPMSLRGGGKGGTSLTAKPKTYTCSYCNSKCKGKPEQTCSHDHFLGSKKFCSYGCYIIHWSDKHLRISI